MKDNCNNESIYNKSSLIWNQVFEYNTTIIMTLFWKYVSFLKNGIKVKEILTTYLKNGVKMGWKLQKKKDYQQKDHCLSLWDTESQN